MERSSGFPLAPRPFDGSSRKVEAGAGFQWLRQGWFFFADQPRLWLTAALLTLLLSTACLMVPVIGHGLVFLPWPTLAAGMLLICRKQSALHPVSLADLLAGFRRKTSALFLMGAITVLLVCGAFWCAHLLSGRSGLTHEFLALFLGLLLSLPALLAISFAPALCFFNDMPPLDAMKASFNACLHNGSALLTCSVLALLLLVLTLLSIGTGLFLFIPVMGGSLFAAYRDIFPGT